MHGAGSETQTICCARRKSCGNTFGRGFDSRRLHHSGDMCVYACPRCNFNVFGDIAVFFLPTNLYKFCGKQLDFPMFFGQNCGIGIDSRHMVGKSTVHYMASIMNQSIWIVLSVILQVNQRIVMNIYPVLSGAETKWRQIGTWRSQHLSDAIWCGIEDS